MTRLPPLLWRWRLGLTLAFLGLLGLVLLLSGWGLARALERSTTYRYFDEAFGARPDLPLSLDWQDNPALDRPLTPADKRQIALALTEGWSLFSAALATGAADYLPDRFSGPALGRARHAAQTEPGQAPDGRGMVILHQRPRADFFHLDGSVLSLTDQALTLRYQLGPEGELTDLRLAIDTNRSILMNESTGWHIYAHERLASQSLAPSRAGPAALPRLAGVNYYPAATPWRKFWANYDPKVIDADMRRTRDLGGNAWRIFLPRADFLDPDRQARNLPHLQDLLDRARAHELYILPVLFDLKHDYSPHLWPHDTAMLRQVLPVLAASDRVVLVDLKNEPDLDYDQAGRGLVQAWLAAMAASAREIAPQLRLTVGFAAADPAGDLHPMVDGWLDVVSYHDYATLSGTAERLQALRPAAGDRPILVTEIGQTSWELLAGLPSSASYQARAITRRSSALVQAEGVFLWTLHDFAGPDPAAIGRSPWVQGIQSRFGLFDSEGRPKPAAQAASQFFNRFLNEVQDEQD